MAGLKNRLDALSSSMEGRTDGRELWLRCPFCRHRSLGLSIGESSRLIAHCVGPSCKGRRGDSILKTLSLPTSPLDDADLREVSGMMGVVRAASLSPRAGIEARDDAYRSLLAACVPGDDEAAFLAPRRLVASRYGCWPPPPGASIPFAKDVPGILDKGHGKAAVALDDARYRGLLFPCRDTEGRIFALKVRLYDPTAEGKMRLLSSAAFGGPEAEYGVHVPLGTFDGSPLRSIIVVEGELKADTVSRLGYKAIALPGVHGSGGILKPVLKSLGVESVVLALDQDRPGHEGTLALMASLVGEYAITYLDWDAKHKGLDDLLLASGSPTRISGPEAVDLLAARVPKHETTPPPPGARATSSPVVRLYDGATILDTEWVAPPFIVPDLLPAGLSLLAGKSKIGKSFFVLDLAMSVATGTPFLGSDAPLEQGKVMLLAFEDTPRNLRKRMQSLMQGREEFKESLKKNLVVAPSISKFPRMPGGMAYLKEKLLKEADTPYKLVIIDTLEKFRPQDEDGKKHSYSGDYELLEDLKAWAEDHAMAVLLIHHVRKNIKDADDVFDTILGSTGILGAPDTLLLLTRARGSDNGRLIAAGREVEHQDMAVGFDQSMGRWLRLASASPGADALTPAAWLAELLKDGEPLESSSIYKQASGLGWTEKMMKDAKASIGDIEAKKVGKTWVWRRLLPKVDRIASLQARIEEAEARKQTAIDDNRFEDAAESVKELKALQAELDTLQGT